jgi:ribosome-binding ATPase YchF (GTP1/OBG family)
VRDLVLYRFGSTGVVQVLQAAADILGLIPVYPVKNIHNFGGQHVFRDCVLVPKGTTVGAVAKRIMGDIPIAAIEGVGGSKISDTQPVDIGRNDIFCFRTGPKQA